MTEVVDPEKGRGFFFKIKLKPTCIYIRVGGLQKNVEMV